MSDENNEKTLAEALSEMTAPPEHLSEVVPGVRVVTRIDEPAPVDAEALSTADTDPPHAADEALWSAAGDAMALEADALMETALADGEELVLPEDAPLPPPAPAAPAPLSSHRLDAVPSNLTSFETETGASLRDKLSLAALASIERAKANREALGDESNADLARFDELRLEPTDVQLFLEAGVRLVLMPHLPLPAEVLLEDAHAREQVDPTEPVLLPIEAAGDHPELAARIEAENENRLAVAASNKEQRRIAAENSVRENEELIARLTKEKADAATIEMIRRRLVDAQNILEDLKARDVKN